MRLLERMVAPVVEPAPRFLEHRCDQRTPAWFAARLGRLTASRAADMLATLKGGGEAAVRRTLRTQLVLERVTGVSQETGFATPAMLQGIEREADARRAYEALTGSVVQTSGFLAHPTLMAGASLDGHLGAFDAIVELKCPLPTTHLEYLRTSQIPDAYRKQMVHALWISGAAWCDWVSYCPEFPERLQLKRLRLAAVPAELLSYEVMVRGFLAEVEREVAEVVQLAGDA